MCPWMLVKTHHKMQSETWIDKPLILLDLGHHDLARKTLSHSIPWHEACFTSQFENLGFCSMRPNAILALGGKIHATLF